jgi:hypothetical protein
VSTALTGKAGKCETLAPSQASAPARPASPPPDLRTYPGARVPRPLEILEHHGDSPWSVVLEEVLALTKLNWNTAAFACSDPITTAFARRVGQIVAELPRGYPLKAEYRFYM